MSKPDYTECREGKHVWALEDCRLHPNVEATLEPKVEILIYCAVCGLCYDDFCVGGWVLLVTP